MTGKERILATLRGGAVDHFAFMPITMSLAAAGIGVKYKRYATDWREQARAQLAFAEAFGADHVSVISDPCVEAADLGAAIIAPEDEPAGLDESGSLLADKAMFAPLRLPAAGQGARASNRLAAISELARQSAGELFVEGWVEGPCAEAADLRGLSRIMIDFYDDPVFVRDLVAFVTDMEIDFALAQLRAGADIIGVGDAASSLIGPGLFGEFILAAHRRYVEAIHAAGGLARLHICGNSTALLPFTKSLGYDLIDLDWMVSLAAARAEAGSAQVFTGNVDPVAVVRDETPGNVYSSLEACREEVGGSGWIVGAGCEIPRGSPRENILAMHNFAAGSRPSSPRSQESR